MASNCSKDFSPLLETDALNTIVSIIWDHCGIAGAKLPDGKPFAQPSWTLKLYVFAATIALVVFGRLGLLPGLQRHREKLNVTPQLKVQSSVAVSPAYPIAGNDDDVQASKDCEDAGSRPATYVEAGHTLPSETGVLSEDGYFNVESVSCTRPNVSRAIPPTSPNNEKDLAQFRGNLTAIAEYQTPQDRIVEDTSQSVASTDLPMGRWVKRVKRIVKLPLHRSTILYARSKTPAPPAPLCKSEAQQHFLAFEQQMKGPVSKSDLPYIGQSDGTCCSHSNPQDCTSENAAALGISTQAVRSASEREAQSTAIVRACQTPSKAAARHMRGKPASHIYQRCLLGQTQSSRMLDKATFKTVGGPRRRLAQESSTPAAVTTEQSELTTDRTKMPRRVSNGVVEVSDSWDQQRPRKNLVWSAAGKKSVHLLWTAGTGAQNFDLWINDHSYSHPRCAKEGADMYVPPEARIPLSMIPLRMRPTSSNA
ncbi:hypothetical protein CYMTET_48862 [Cymbomonas tetramitiformis]|uniref:Uncharacterized protein n=1 Tax=Cymbomonas tetramitiformis TaxID=36881 RepID=A0AAE0EVA8_9CHLO|nr:hypothetical protein CYMTET_48862 [Cymbomonas tetramitiformis]